MACSANFLAFSFALNTRFGENVDKIKKLQKKEIVDQAKVGANGEAKSVSALGKYGKPII